MKITSHQNTVYPQTVEIPEPLEIHPSIPQDLAQEMIRVAELFTVHPELYDGFTGAVFSETECGCIIGHLGFPLRLGEVGITNKERVLSKWPQFSTAFQRIYGEAASCNDPVWAVDRISHFLSTGQ